MATNTAQQPDPIQPAPLLSTQPVAQPAPNGMKPVENTTPQMPGVSGQPVVSPDGLSATEYQRALRKNQQNLNKVQGQTPPVEPTPAPTPGVEVAQPEPSAYTPSDRDWETPGI